jgi:hypothetical protein
MTTVNFPPAGTGGMDTFRIRPRKSGAESCFFSFKRLMNSTSVFKPEGNVCFPLFYKPYFPDFIAFGANFLKGASRTFVSEPKSIRSGNSYRVLAGRSFSNTQSGIAARIPAVSQTLLPNKSDYDPDSRHSIKYTAGSLYLQQQQNQLSG